MKYLLSLCFAVLGSIAQAYDWPARYSVIGVADGDLLAIHADTSIESEVLAGYVFDAKAVEVIELSADGIWGRVNLSESTGWIAMENMLRVEDNVPTTYACFGSDPSWNLNLSESGASRWQTPDTDGAVKFEAEADKLTFNGQITMTETSVRPGLEVKFDAKMTPAACTYPAKNNLFGLKIDVLLKGFAGFASPEGDEAVSGCCSLQP